MLRLTALILLTLGGLFGALLVFGNDLSEAEQAELEALKAERISVVSVLTEAFGIEDSSILPALPASASEDANTQTPRAVPAPVTDTGITVAAPQAISDTNPAPLEQKQPEPSDLPPVAQTDLMPALAPLPVIEPEAASLVRRVITGNRVNVRAGPSTANAVLGQVVRDDVVSVLSDPDDAWVQILRDRDGLEGYMASRFLAPIPE